jgi:hypothetical protein
VTRAERQAQKRARHGFKVSVAGLLVGIVGVVLFFVYQGSGDSHVDRRREVLQSFVTDVGAAKVVMTSEPAYGEEAGGAVTYLGPSPGLNSIIDRLDGYCSRLDIHDALTGRCREAVAALRYINSPAVVNGAAEAKMPIVQAAEDAFNRALKP